MTCLPSAAHAVTSTAWVSHTCVSHGTSCDQKCQEGCSAIAQNVHLESAIVISCSLFDHMPAMNSVDTRQDTQLFTRR